MPMRKERKFCTVFVRSEQEKKAAALVKDMDTTKAELESTKEALSTLMAEVQQLRSAVK